MWTSMQAEHVTRLASVAGISTDGALQERLPECSESFCSTW